MKNLSHLTLTAALAIIGQVAIHAASSVSNPNIITVDGTTAPASGSNDVTNYFTYSPSEGEYDGSNGFSNGSAPGQTFLTPGATQVAGAYNLNSITLQESAGSGGGYVGNVFALGIFSVSGNNLTSLGVDYFTLNGVDPGTAGYFTLDVSDLGLKLASDTQYAFSFNNATGGGYLGLVSSGEFMDAEITPGSTYANGMAINADPTAASESFSTPVDDTGNAYDRAFSVGLSAAPEPSTWALMIGGLILLAAAAHRRLRA